MSGFSQLNPVPVANGGTAATTAAGIATLLATVGGIGKSKVLTFTRDLTTASGSVAYTGMGFQPNMLLGFGALGSTGFSTTYASFADSARSSAAVYITNAAAFTTTTNFLAFQDVAANFQVATISSYDADGFTLSWTKGGASGSAVVTFYILGIRQ